MKRILVMAVLLAFGLSLSTRIIHADPPTCPAIQGDLLTGGTITVDENTWVGDINLGSQGWLGSSELIGCDDFGRDYAVPGKPLTLRFLDDFGNYHLVRFYAGRNNPMGGIALEIISPLAQTASTSIPPVVGNCWGDFRSACGKLEYP